MLDTRVCLTVVNKQMIIYNDDPSLEIDMLDTSVCLTVVNKQMIIYNDDQKLWMPNNLLG